MEFTIAAAFFGAAIWLLHDISETLKRILSQLSESDSRLREMIDGVNRVETNTDPIRYQYEDTHRHRHDDIL